MNGSGILEQTVTIKKVNKRQATHFVICNEENIRYLVSLDGGKRRLSSNISTYSSKLGLLMKILCYVPFRILSIAKIGYFANAKLNEEIQEVFDKSNAAAWNMIVGTYDEKQKVVLQCFAPDCKLSTFIKVGNESTEREMTAEIDFLKRSNIYKEFDVPVLLSSKKRSDGNQFNIQVTKEFVGNKVEPALNEDIIKIYKEISSNTKVIDGLEYEFSHGDFAPWNMKNNNGRYVVFDWEHCGYRVKGFDLMHFATIVEIVIGGKGFAEAFDSALVNIRRFDSEFNIDKRIFSKEFERLRTQID